MEKKCFIPMEKTRLFTGSILIVIFMAACDQSNKKSTTDIKPTYLPPVTVLIDTCPPPETVDLKTAQIGESISIKKTSDGSFELRTPVGKLVTDLNPPTVYKAAPPIANFTNFNTEDGLVLSTIYCGLCDKNGNLWFGSEGGGISCYNGKSFTNYTAAEGLIDNNVKGIVEDDNGNIWIGTDAGLSRYDGQSFTNYGPEQSYIFAPIRSMIKDKSGKVWIGTLGSGVISFDPAAMGKEGKGFTRLTFPEDFQSNVIRDIIEDKNGNLWFGSGNGIIRYNPSIDETSAGRFTIYTTEQGLAGNEIRSMFVDKQGIIWAGTWGGGLCRYEPENDKAGTKCFTTYSEEDGLASNFVRSIFENEQGNLWIGAWGGGVSLMHSDRKEKTGQLFTNYTTEQGLAYDRIQCIIDDYDGNVWFGTHGGGLSRYNGESVFAYQLTKGLLGNRVKSIMEDSHGNLWFAPEAGGISRFDGKNYINYNLNNSREDSFYSIAEDIQGNLWFGSWGGIRRFVPSHLEPEGGVLTRYDLGRPDLTFAITPDSKGNVWFVNNRGVVRFSGDDFTVFTRSQGLVNESFNCIIEDQNKDLWIGTDGGVSRYNGSSFTNFTTAQGLVNDEVICILEDFHGYIWIGTKGGISRYDGHDFVSFTAAQGLATNEIRGMKIDEQGLLWIGTTLGLSSLQFKLSKDQPEIQKIQAAGVLDINNEELKDYTPVWKIYNSNTGYPIKDMFANAMTLTKVGFPEGSKNNVDKIWGAFADDKVIRFDPKALCKSDKPPLVFIESIKIKEEIIPWYYLASMEIDSTVKAQQEIMAFGRELTPQEQSNLHSKFNNIKFSGITKNFPIPQNLVLPYQHNQVSFEFGAIETGRPEQVRYQYKLEGYNTAWNPVTAKTSATFGNMYEGKYTFKVKAMNPDGVWSEPVKYTFRVMPPFWRSWLAYFTYLIIFLAAVWQVHLFQKKRTIRIEREKTQKRELEHAREIEKAYTELKSTQSQLIQSEKMASLGELTAGIAHEIQNPLNFVNNFSEVSNELLHEMKEELVSSNLQLASEIADDVIQNLEKILHHGKRADAIVKGMLQHSRTSTGQKELTDINALADEYLRLAYHGLRAKDKSFNADFKTEFDETLPKINIIPQDIGRVLLNLINNAFYAVDKRAREHPLPPKGGSEESGVIYKPTIVVSTASSKSPSGDLGVKISVKDNGPGIPQNIVDKIFQPFFTTKPTGQGTGLGLSLSYDIVKAHGGKIKVESVEGEGTEFIIQIPVIT